MMVSNGEKISVMFKCIGGGGGVAAHSLQGPKQMLESEFQGGNRE